MNRHASDDHWLARPENIRRICIVLLVVLAATVLVQSVVKVKGYFGIDGWFGFAAGFGFLACVAMVLVAKALAPLLKRDERYYDD